MIDYTINIPLDTGSLLALYEDACWTACTDDMDASESRQAIIVCYQCLG